MYAHPFVAAKHGKNAVAVKACFLTV